MKTIALTTLVFAVLGAVITPLVALKLLPVCYSGSAASSGPQIPGSMMPFFILAMPGIVVAGALEVLGMKLEIAVLALGGFIGHGIVGFFVGSMLALIRKRRKSAR